MPVPIKVLFVCGSVEIKREARLRSGYSEMMRECAVIEFNDSRTGKWTLTVNKNTLAILESKQVHTITAEQSKTMMEETRIRMKEKNIPYPEPKMPEHDYTIETVTTFKNAAFDQEMAATDFVFKEQEKSN